MSNQPWSPLVIALFALGGLIQVGGIGYAVLGFEDVNLPLLIGALVVGSMVEVGGFVVLQQQNR